MPLSSANPRRKLHTRTIVLEGYEREDGLFEVEASLRDEKTYGYTTISRGQIGAGDPVHLMRIRIAFDLDMKIHEAEAATDAAPWVDCPNASANFKRLVGLTLGTITAEQRAESRRSWGRGEVIASGLVLVAILAAYLYFRG